MRMSGLQFWTAPGPPFMVRAAPYGDYVIDVPARSISRCDGACSVPKPHLREKGPGTHCMRMR